ncbi:MULTISPECIES: hypothetical protein [unclassified Paraburkholderia]|uniref:hypothetical protein n=1 Tax=unclassified Paraburkholderia TaxID=2615204 RepID=UPI00197E8499|nr:MULTISPECIES: hypothetical protein [unclassified Paraburkholderia]MBN3853176.1 hypothetical protein [Paraburkholderia sp. Ac-20340]
MARKLLYMSRSNRNRPATGLRLYQLATEGMPQSGNRQDQKIGQAAAFAEIVNQENRL